MASAETGSGRYFSGLAPASPAPVVGTAGRMAVHTVGTMHGPGAMGNNPVYMVVVTMVVRHVGMITPRPDRMHADWRRRRTRMAHRRRANVGRARRRHTYRQIEMDTGLCPRGCIKCSAQACQHQELNELLHKVKNWLFHLVSAPVDNFYATKGKILSILLRINDAGGGLRGRESRVRRRGSTQQHIEGPPPGQPPPEPRSGPGSPSW